MDDLDRLDMLATLDKALADGRIDETIPSAIDQLQLLYGEHTDREIARIAHEWKGGLTKEPRPEWSDAYIAENRRVFGDGPPIDWLEKPLPTRASNASKDDQ